VADVQPHQPLRSRPWSPPSPAAEPAGPRLALSTTWGVGRLADLGDLVDDARRLGVDQLALGPGCTADHVEQIIAHLGNDVRLCSLTNVCPWPLDDADRPATLPSLAEPDPIAREIIVRWTEETIRLASHWGVPVVVLSLDPLTGATDHAADLALLLPGAADPAVAATVRSRLLAHRHAIADAAFEALVRSLDDLLPLCEEAGVHLGVTTPASLFAPPSLEEMFELLARFTGAPLGYWHDTGHAERLRLAGLRPAQDWLTTFAARLVGFTLHDVVDGDDLQPPGTGQIDFGAVLAGATAATPCVVAVGPQATLDAVAQSLAFLQARLPQPTGSQP
jgi:sugar phosphate isomerase/epimerase